MTGPGSWPRGLVLLGLLFVLGCGDAAEAPATDRVSHETVERYRTEALLRTQALDARIAEIEADAAAADSATAAALQTTIDALHAARQAVQQGLDTLGGQPEAVFQEATRATEAQLEALERRLLPPDSAAADTSAAG